MHKKQPTPQREKKGMTLVLALIVTSILLLFGFDIANISAKELYLSSFGKESGKALFMADSMFECVLYWDIKSNGVMKTGGDMLPFFPYSGGPTQTDQISCMGVSFTPGVNVSGPTYSYQTPYVDSNNVSHPGTTYISLVPLGNVTGPCASATVVKTQVSSSPVKYSVVLTVNGDNTCDPSQPRRVERGFNITYTELGP